MPSPCSGYTYGAAVADVWHLQDDSFMLYPGYTPGGELYRFKHC